MIKLINQFDNEKTKLSLATPTCGCCCCCCCCCIVSTITASSISARTIGGYVAEKLPNKPEKIKTARNWGFFIPIGLVIVNILFLLSSASFINDISLPGLIILIEIVYIAFMSHCLNKTINIPGLTLKVIGSVILVDILEIVGLLVGLNAISSLGFLYLPIAIFISFVLITSVFTKKYEKKDLTKKEKTITKKDEPNIEKETKKVQQPSKIKNNNKEVLTKDKEISKIEKKTCPNCGTENHINNKYCIYCSNKFEKDDEN